MNLNTLWINSKLYANAQSINSRRITKKGEPSGVGSSLNMIFIIRRL